MKWSLPLIGILLLSACEATVSSGAAICEIPFPTLTESEALALSDETITGIDLYFAQINAACNGR